jgi:hypothetical protein
VACLPADNCFSELSLYKAPTQRVGQVQSVHRHHVIKCNLFYLHDIAKKNAHFGVKQ